MAEAGDGATEALELRLHAELAIAEERAGGRAPLADAMTDVLPGLLREYMASRDETIALDVVDAAFIREQVKVAELMQEPGLALALDVFAGEGTGFEHNLRASLTSLADFHEVRAHRATEASLRVYEREVSRRLEHVDKIEENHRKVESHRVEATLVAVADHFTGQAEEKIEKTQEKAQEKIEKTQEKAEEKVEKTQEKAEEKAEKEQEKAEEKAEKEQEKAEEKDKGSKEGGKDGK